MMTYYIEDLTIEELDRLVEKGKIFDVTSKTSVLSKSESYGDRDAFWRDGDKRAEDLRSTVTRKSDS